MAKPMSGSRSRRWAEGRVPSIACCQLARLVASAVLCVTHGAALAAVVQELSDPGYGIKPVPAKFEKDAETTFLADFSVGHLQVVHAAGEPAARGVAPQFVPDGGVKGQIEIPGGANIRPDCWTVELLLRVPPGLERAEALPLLSWRAGKDIAARLVTTPGSTQGSVQGMGADHFRLAASVGGNGHAIQRDGAGQWVYLAWGVDAATGRANMIARSPDGDVLATGADFISPGCFRLVDQSPPGPPAASPAGIALSSARVETILLGCPEVEIRSVRISRVFRDGLLYLQPERALKPGAVQVFTADQLDPAHAVLRTVQRRLGYPGGASNHGTATMNEAILPLSAGAPPFEIKLKQMKIGLYTLYVYGQIDPKGRKDLDHVWKPCPLRFQLKGESGKVMTYGNLLLKQAFFNRLMQAYDFHVDRPGDYTAVFQISPRAMETAEITHMVLADRLAELPDKAIKIEQVLGKGATARLTALTEERRKRDEMIWNALPPLNLHMQVHSQVAEFSKPPAAARVGVWQTRAFVGMPSYAWGKQAFAPLDFVKAGSGEVFPAEKIVAGEPWPGNYGDDGTGIYFPKADFPELPCDVYYCPRAEMLGRRYLVFVGALADHEGYSKQATAYFEKGDPNDGHDAAMALVRLAYDWPALEMTFHEIRLCTHAPDLEYNTDWTGIRRNGKFYYRGWSGFFTRFLFEAYDKVFPYIQDNPLFADEVHRFIPWVKTPHDVVRFLDRWLVFSSVRDARVDLIDKGAGVEEAAGQVLGPHPVTLELFDLTRTLTMLHPLSGRFQELYGAGLTRDGVHYIGSFYCYALGEAVSTLSRAAIIAQVKAKGLTPKMDLSDANRYPKVRGAAHFLFDMFQAGGFPMMVGDASGGPHCGRVAVSWAAGNAEAFRNAFTLCGDPRAAWVLKNLCGDTRPGVAKAAEGVRNPYLHNPSRVLAGAGAAVVEMGVDETDATRKTAAFLRLGLGRGHAHSDYLDVNFFAMGLPVAADLACRNEGDNWSRPHAGWSELHNHAIVHSDLDPKTDQQNGEPWLRAFAPPWMRGSYAEPDGRRVDRDILLMELGESGQYYALDLQRVQGGTWHTWSFHGCESEDLKLNVPMKDETHRWVDRTLKGTQKAGTATDCLQAVWTMARRGREIPHDFDKGGMLKTVGCEPAVLGNAYDASKPEVHVRATLLGRAGDLVLQGNPFSQRYDYCFPFLWVQHEARGGQTVYPAVYEWYRGDGPAVKSTEILSREPLAVRIVTAAGQTDAYALAGESLSAVSSDAKGIRWAMLSGGDSLKGDGISIKAATAAYATTIAAIDYARRTLAMKAPLPADPLVTVGNAGRWTVLQLRGQGTQFTFADDLLIHEGEIRKLTVTGEDQIDVEPSQPLLFAGAGNRSLSAFTMTNEDGTWQFRGFTGRDADWKGGKVISKPEGARLARDVFRDANGDGFVNLKAYEIGVGDSLSLYSAVTLRRVEGRYEILTNVPVDVQIGNAHARAEPSPKWQVELPLAR